MQTTSTPSNYPATTIATGNPSPSAVSWAAVFAGAVIAAALSAMLIIGGTGLGFLAISPWQTEGASGTAVTIGTIVWLLLTQIIAYGVAGYVTGRLRTKWVDVRGDEVYFRDTAHGFLVWALSVVVSMALLGSALSSAVSGVAKAGADVAGATATAAVSAASNIDVDEKIGNPVDYFVDTMLRSDTVDAQTPRGDIRQEVSRIVTRSLAQGQLDEADRTYLTRVVAQRAGIDEATAQQRVNEVIQQAEQSAKQLEQTARETADNARKAAATLALWAFASMLIGAFIASLAATFGGRARDKW